jgi:3-hydroxybutyryl-CoA dehydrogenase
MVKGDSLMKLNDVKKVGLIGCGVIGRTIGAAISIKYDIVIKRANERLLDEGRKGVIDCLPSLVRRNVITQVEREMAVSRITMATELEQLSDCQVIIDCTPDDFNLKVGLLSKLNKICPQETVFTTASSILSVTALASGCGRPDRMIGTHFSLPAHLMKLVEVAPAVQTSGETITFIMEFLTKGLGKVTIKTKDWPGFVVNFLAIPFLLQAVRALELGLGTAEDIDNAAKLGLGHPMGPFEMMDNSGLDSAIVSFPAIQEQLQGDPRFAIPTTLRKLYDAGFLGRKSKKGWYEYDDQGKKIGLTKLP